MINAVFLLCVCVCSQFSNRDFKQSQVDCSLLITSIHYLLTCYTQTCTYIVSSLVISKGETLVYFICPSVNMCAEKEITLRGRGEGWGDVDNEQDRKRINKICEKSSSWISHFNRPIFSCVKFHENRMVSGNTYRCCFKSWRICHLTSFSYLIFSWLFLQNMLKEDGWMDR